MRIRVAHCIDDLSRGGAQYVVRMLVRYGDRTRFAPMVYTFRDGPIGEEIRACEIPVHVLGRGLPMLDLGLVMRIRQRLVQDQIDLVHAHLLGSRLHCSLASSLGLHVPCIASIQNSVDPYPRRRRIAERWVLGRMSRVVAVSALVRESLGRLDAKLEERAQVIYNGIDPGPPREERRREAVRQELGIDANRTVLLAIGRLHPQKGYDVLVNAVAKVAKICPMVILLIAGKGQLYDELKSLRARLAVNRHVCLLGERADVPDLVAAADIFVMSSLWEGLPLALLDAMAGGLPCVATAVGGIPEVISHGKNGLLAPAKDPDALAAALLSLLYDVRTRKRLGEAARQTVLQRFDARQMVAAYESIYNEVLAD